MSGLARNTDPDTSHEAAKLNTSTLESRVLEAINANGPMTTEEIAQATGIDLQSITPRIAPLRRRGYIFDSGLRRNGASGRSRIVWAAAEEIIPEPVKTKKLDEKEILQIASRHTKYMTGKTAWAMDVVSLIRELEARWNIK
jgi:DNA-binding Lrp family transcriptional regulator